jgi:hypothetical protein
MVAQASLALDVPERGAVCPALAIERCEPAVLETAAQPYVHLAVWHRRFPEALDWLGSLDWSAIDDCERTSRVEVLPVTIADGLAAAGYPYGARGTALCDEIVGLARHFAGALKLDAVTVRLEVIETDACRKFHADYVAARLLCTLVGQGTQWRYGPDVADTPIRQLRTGDVAIFKGRLATDTPAILHRSPPILGTGETRLLLAIDPA